MCPALPVRVVRHVEHEEGQLHHIAEAGPDRGQAAMEVLEHLPRLNGGIPGSDQFTALILSDLAAHHDQPTTSVRRIPRRLGAADQPDLRVTAW